jgi:hypothetical protein
MTTSNSINVKPRVGRVQLVAWEFIYQPQVYPAVGPCKLCVLMHTRAFGCTFPAGDGILSRDESTRRALFCRVACGVSVDCVGVAGENLATIVSAPVNAFGDN